jgi:ElaB/YqjD/DUF883 family membrane-anchored ribosome-binding protein
MPPCRPVLAAPNAIAAIVRRSTRSLALRSRFPQIVPAGWPTRLIQEQRMKTESESLTQTPEQVLGELRALVAEAEKILGNQNALHVESTVEALRERLEAAQERLAEFYDKTRRKVMSTARQADETVRSHPYESLLIAAAFGLLAGVLVGRRTK